MKIRDVLIRLIGARDPNCPNEADVLAYSEGRLSASSRSTLETHFAQCDDCRQILVFLGRAAADSPTSVTVTKEVAAAQTDRVLTYIQNDERKAKSAQNDRAAGFYVSYPRLAAAGLGVCAIAIAAVFMFTRTQAPTDAMDALRLAVKNARFTEARVSGGFDYSPYAGPTRGGDRNDDDLLFSRAENKAKARTQQTDTAKARLVLARVYLARGAREDARRALEILDQISKQGVEAPEALNDTGVAQFQLDRYDEAITNFTKALAKSPHYDEALFNRALAEGRARHEAEAAQDWRQFIDQSSDENWKNEARSHLNRLSAPTDR